jgi:cysteine synthase A
MDRNGGYLISRLEMIEKLQRELSNVYWINQYANPLNAEAYYQSLGTEICNAFPDELHYVFLGVSSGGTITGLSRKIKERFPRARVVAVDIYGSVIFGHQPAKRVIPGIGSSIVPPILQRAHIDEVVLVSELETILQCRELVEQQYIFAGGSSGSVYAALKKYFSRLPPGPRQNVVCIFPDRGERYCSTIYDNRWYNDFILKCAGMRHAAESPAQLELQNQ